MEPYYLSLDNLSFDLLDLVFEDYRIEDNDNPFTEGIIYPDVERQVAGFPAVIRKSQRTFNSEYLSRDETFTVYTIEYNGKTFKSMSAKDFSNAGFKDGDIGVHSGVRYYVNYRPGTSPNVYYNMNDMAKYFGVDRAFHFDSEDMTCLVIE